LFFDAGRRACVAVRVRCDRSIETGDAKNIVTDYTPGMYAAGVAGG